MKLSQMLRDMVKRNSRVNLILACETFLNEKTTKFVQLPGYNFVSNVRMHTKGGRTGIFIRSGILYKIHKDLAKFQKMLIESMFTKMTLKNGKWVIVGSMYHSPNTDNNNNNNNNLFMK